MPRFHDKPGGKGGVAVSPHRNDRSGLIDIRALSSVIDAQRTAVPTASASSVALPSFNSPWAYQDTRRPAATPAAMAAVPARAPAPLSTDNRPLYAMIIGLSVAVASLGVYILFHEPPRVVMKAAATPAPRVTTEAEPPPPSRGEGAATLVAAAVPAPADEPALAEAKEAPAAAEAPTVEATRKPGRTRSPRGRTPKPRPTPTKPRRESKGDGTVPIECVLHPESKQCGGGGTKTPTPDDPSKPLPASPSAAATRAAMAKVKSNAKKCGPRHGASSGDKVKVKLSVVGKTGVVDSANAIDAYAGTALGRCVAAALSKAKLPRFSKPRAGIVYSVRM
ncbi:MAG: hypothetical protein K0V04_33995 [Deltaproteobacteria bacterium]|nr:hypothetical protein [Deltaproteobacteria bacterium]